MKSRIIQITCILLAMGLLMACEETEDPISLPGRKVIVEFDQSELSISENQGHYYVRMPFNKTAVKGGLVTLAISNFDASRIKVEPALKDGRIELVVWENSQFATLHLMPIDNSLKDGDLSFNISIVKTCPNFTIGNKSTISVTMTDDDSPSLASLAIPEGKMPENNATGKQLAIAFSKPLATAASMRITLTSAKAIYGTHFTSEPAAVGGVIDLNIEAMATSATFAILPMDNSILTGHLDVMIAMEVIAGPINAGPAQAQKIEIVDDELKNMPKSYSVGGGQWGLAKTFEYDQAGRIQYVHVEKSTPTTSTHTETYSYDAGGRISKITMYPQIERVFIWSQGRITRSEDIDYGVLKVYTDYDYDENGNISGAANYFRQPNGTFKLGFLNTYLYFNDGNLFKQQTYIAGDEPEEYTLLSTRTFEDYIDEENPFPMVDILPNSRTQSKLPGRYTIEEHGMTLNYLLTYEYTTDRLVKRRTAISGMTSEVTTYEYY